MILDTFTFVDLHRTLELNPSEGDRFKQNLIDVLKGKLELEKLLSGRARAEAATQPKIEVATRVRFDSQSSSTATLLELVAQTGLDCSLTSARFLPIRGAILKLL